MDGLHKASSKTGGQVSPKQELPQGTWRFMGRYRLGYK